MQNCRKNFHPFLGEGDRYFFTHKRPHRYNCTFTWCERKQRLKTKWYFWLVL